MKRSIKEYNYPSNNFEIDYWNKDMVVAGIDEAGRGCLAGPVVAAAVIIPKNFDNILGFDDSKRLSSKKRDYFFDYILNNDFDFGIGIVDNIKIDEINILEATHLAIKNAYNSLKTKPDFLLIDGNHFRGFEIPFRLITSGDRLCLSIAIASIIAKVTRDELMINKYAVEYPNYYFERNKGYGTQKHITAIKKFGISEIHRKSFLKNIFQNNFSLF